MVWVVLRSGMNGVELKLGLSDFPQAVMKLFNAGVLRVKIKF